MKNALFLMIVMLFFSSSFSIEKTAVSKVVGVFEENGEYLGIIAEIKAEIREGSGRVFVDTMPLSQIDTQVSARIAKETACDILSADCTNLDFSFSLISPVKLVGGPSAGSVFTILLMSLLSDKPLKENVLMTGTINPDGSIGPVSGIFEKAKTAYQNKAEVFLIPYGERIDYLDNSTDVVDYFEKNTNMKVIEVKSIEEAFEYFTGFEIIKQEAEEINNTEYNEVLKQMSEELINYSNSIKSYLMNLSVEDTNLKLFIEDRIEFNSNLLNLSENLYKNSSYYSSSSFAVQAGVGLKYAENILKLENLNNTDYIKEKIEQIELQKENLKSSILNININSIKDIEFLSAGIDRLYEAENLIKNATFSFLEKDYYNSLSYISFAEVRLKTAELWLSRVNFFSSNETFSFDETKLFLLAEARLELARNAVLYAETISSSPYLYSAKEFVEKSEKAFIEKNYIFSIFESIHARAMANLAMETRGLSEEGIKIKLIEKQESALLSITKAKKEGLFPVLALSYYEYSDSLNKNGDINSAIIYSSYSKEFSKISKEISLAVNSSSIYEKPKTDIISSKEIPSAEIDPFFFLALGFVLGFFLAKKIM